MKNPSKKYKISAVLDKIKFVKPGVLDPIVVIERKGNKISLSAGKHKVTIEQPKNFGTASMMEAHRAFTDSLSNTGR